MSRSSSVKSPSLTVKSAARVLDLMEELVGERQGLSFTEIVERLRLPLSSAHGLLGTLDQRGYLVRGQDGRIRLGPAFGRIAVRYVEGSDLMTAAVPVMQRVNQICGHTVGLVTYDAGEITCVHQEVGLGPFRVTWQLGGHYPAYTSATGKAVLALLPIEELDRMYPSERLPALTAHTITDRATLYHELERVRRTGVGHHVEEAEHGLLAVGSALRDHRGSPLGGVSIDWLKAHPDNTLSSRLAALIRAAAALINRQLGYDDLVCQQVRDLDSLTEMWEAGARIRDDQVAPALDS